jgi:glycosyltransferase involved in cell wall biosynthesis
MGGDTERAHVTFSEQREIGRRFADLDLLTLTGLTRCRAGRRLIMCVTTKNERERGYWAERVEPLLGDDVEVRDEVSQQEKAELSAGAAALLFPIQWPEPFGLVMTEAMACGTPVIAWGNGSVPEVVADGQTGVVVSSVEEMAAAVDRAGELDPRVLRQRVQERFSAEAMVTSYERIYQRVLAGGHEAGRVAHI